MFSAFLRGKTALVTGSTSGIGWGVAQGLARAGANVCLNGFADAATVAQLRSEIEGLGVECHYLGADLTRVEEIEAMMAAAAQVGGIDILVNNAGMQFVADTAHFPDDKWQQIIALNLSAAFHTSKRVLPTMQARGWGRIVNIASVHGLVASVNKVAYIAAKHGLVGLTKAVALEQAQSAITCNAICPGWVHTPLVAAQIKAKAEREGVDSATAQSRLLGEKQPSGRFVTPDQIAALVVFLCSEAASEVRGAAWTIDGGWTAQ